MENNKQSRGGCLTAFIILIIIGSVWGILSTFTSSAMTNLDQFPQQVKDALEAANSPFVKYSGLIFNIITLASGVLMLMWKKLGVQLYVGVTIVSTVTRFFTAVSTFTIVTSLISLIIILLIFYYLIRNVYPHMK